MKEYSTDKIRNIALVSHSSAGKTMLAEAYLHTTGVTTRLGRIEDGTTASDFEDEEIRRGISLSTSVLPIEHKDHKINFLDTPGYTDFVGEVISSLRVADGAIVVVDSVAGAEVGTEIGWNFADEFNLPRFVVINKMDRDNANFQKALGTVADSFETRLIPVQLPWGEKAEFKGVLDLLSMKAYAGAGKDGEEIPAEFSDAVEEARMELVEAAAEGDDELLMKYLDGDELSPVEIAAGLRSAILSGEVVPVFVTAATSEIGMYPLADAIISMMPSPADRPAVEAEGASATEELLASDAGPLAAYVW
ncbi:MAG: GTP-binding protein [Chloroflexi bacterium]|nr:GTP-binding protein [Chloroflexota bacterium]